MLPGGVIYPKGEISRLREGHIDGNRFLVRVKDVLGHIKHVLGGGGRGAGVTRPVAGSGGGSGGRRVGGSGGEGRRKSECRGRGIRGGKSFCRRKSVRESIGLCRGGGYGRRPSLGESARGGRGTGRGAGNGGGIYDQKRRDHSDPVVVVVRDIKVSVPIHRDGGGVVQLGRGREYSVPVITRCAGSRHGRNDTRRGGHFSN